MKPLWASPVGCGRLAQDVLKKWTTGVPVTFYHLPSVSKTRPCQEKHTCISTDTYQAHTLSLTYSVTHQPQLSSHPLPVYSCTIIATVIHRCWILLASHKTWYAWFVQSARSVISFSFSFIFPSWATQSIFLLYESADTQRDFQDDYMPRAMGGLRSQHASLRGMSNLGENIYLNKVLNIWNARGVLHLSSETFVDPQVKLSTSSVLYQELLTYIFWSTFASEVYDFAHEGGLLWFKIRTHALMLLWVSGKINQAYLAWLMYLRQYS